MTNGQFEGIIKSIEEGREGDGYHINVVTRSGDSVTGAWGYVPARKDVIYVDPQLDRMTARSVFEETVLEAKTYIDIASIDVIRGPF